MSETASFWARRRAAVRAEAEAEALAAESAAENARTAELAERDDADILAEMGLPDPDAMVQGDDFSAFLSKDVPEHLRRQALRTLWRSNPVLACVDGLNEYDEDYRAAMLIAEPIKTAYQVGKGMMAHVEEMDRQQEEAAAAIANEDDTDQQDAVFEATDVAEQSKADQIEDRDEIAQTFQNEDADEGTLPAPRMRFRFEEEIA